MSKPPVTETVDEIMSLYCSLPQRPSIEEVEAALIVAKTADTELELKIRSLDKMERAEGVPKELFYVATEVRRNVALLQCYEQKREAAHVVEIEKRMRVFDRLIQRASVLVTGSSVEEDLTDAATAAADERLVLSGLEFGIEKKTNKTSVVAEISGSKIDPKEFLRSSSLKGVASFKGYTIPVADSSGGQKLTLIKIAGLIEKSFKNSAKILDLEEKLMDDIESIPISLGKLTELTKLNLSNNRLTSLPSTMGGLRSLTKLNLYSNRLSSLPDSLGELTNLEDLALNCNLLEIIPASIGNLTRLNKLDLCSNKLTILPDSIGNLTQLKKLVVETNNLEELPYTIGSCSSLVELLLNFNVLRALPEAIGKLESLEILSLHYNRIKSLPTTMASLSKLRELDVSFNEVEMIPESLCLVTSLVKLNVSSNFADLTYLPRSIGNLEMLEELDISNNQITMLPESFKMLKNLKSFHAIETPLEFPPREIVRQRAEDIVNYMAGLGVPIEGEVKKSGSNFLSKLCFGMCGEKTSQEEQPQLPESS